MNHAFYENLLNFTVPFDWIAIYVSIVGGYLNQIKDENKNNLYSLISKYVFVCMFCIYIMC